MKIRYFYTKRQFILKVDIDTKNNKIAIRMTSEGILKLCSDYPIKVLEDLSKQLKKLYGQERKQKGVGKEKNRERIKEYQKQLLERSQLYGVTKDMKKNIEYMLGNKMIINTLIWWKKLMSILIKKNTKKQKKFCWKLQN